MCLGRHGGQLKGGGFCWVAKSGGILTFPFMILCTTLIVYIVYTVLGIRKKTINLFLFYKIKPTTSRHREKRFEGNRNKMLAGFDLFGVVLDNFPPLFFTAHIFFNVYELFL